MPMLPISLSIDAYDRSKVFWYDLNYSEYKKELHEAALSSDPMLREAFLGDLYRKLADLFRKLLPSDDKLEALGKDFIRKNGNNIKQEILSNWKEIDQKVNDEIRKNVKESISQQPGFSILEEGPIWDKIKEAMTGTLKVLGIPFVFVIKQVFYTLLALARNPVIQLGIILALEALLIANLGVVTTAIVAFLSSAAAESFLLGFVGVSLVTVSLLIIRFFVHNVFKWMEDPDAAPARLTNLFARGMGLVIGGDVQALSTKGQSYGATHPRSWWGGYI